jgi:hypothetical protein
MRKKKGRSQTPFFNFKPLVLTTGVSVVCLQELGSRLGGNDEVALNVSFPRRRESKIF